MVRNFGLLPKYLRVALFVTGALALVMIGVLAGRAAAENERDSRNDVLRGSYLTWSVINGCEDSNEACEEILAEVNGDDDGVQFFEDGSSYLTEDGRKFE
jgi:hypothetical protein